MSQRTREPRIWLAIYRRVARLYPPALRRELGVEMEGLFLDLYADARREGRARAAWLAARACAEVLPRAFQAHGDPDSPTGAYLVSSFFLDLRFAWQVATRQRRHSLVVIATIAIGIAATTAVFSVVDAAILRRLPFPEGGRLVEVGERHPSGWTIYSQDDAAFRTWSEQTSLFDFVGGHDTTMVVGLIAERPQEIDGVRLSPDLLPLLGARPSRGRLLAPEDAAPGAPPRVMISERLWSQQFARSEDAIGGSLTLDDELHEVVGVLSDFNYPYARTDVWLPIDPTIGPSRMRMLGRLAPGLDIDAAHELADTLAAGLEEVAARSANWQLTLVPLEELRTHVNHRAFLQVALGAAALLLLVAVVNVAQVALARAIQREGELSVRAALGAGRARIVRQVLLESLLLALCGGAIGVFLAMGAVSIIVALAPEALIRIDSIQVGVEARALSVAMLLSVVAGMASGLFPAWSASRPAIRASLHADRGGLSVSRHRRRLQSGLIVGEAALCVVLLAGAGLLLTSFARLSQVDPGFDAERIVSVVLSLDTDRYPTREARFDVLERFGARIAREPGVERVALAGGGAPMPGGVSLTDAVESDDGRRLEEALAIPRASVHDGFFATMGIEIVAGRPLAALDADTENVVLSEPFARRLFGDEPAVGRRVRLGGGDWHEVVGVAASTSVFTLSSEEDDLQMYGYLRGDGSPRSYAGLIVRATGDPAALATRLREAVWEVDPQQPIRKVEFAADQLVEWVVQPRFNLLIFGTFAAVALTLVLIGIGGVVSHAVASRTREIGIRIALGASGRSILSMATLDGLRSVALGLLIGGLAAWQTTHLLSTMLFDVEPTDPWTLGLVAVTFLLATCVASFLPARRALRVNPVRALRAE